jgi:hypothetical protein
VTHGSSSLRVKITKDYTIINREFVTNYHHQRRRLHFVIPAQAGIQSFTLQKEKLDSCSRMPQKKLTGRNDGETAKPDIDSHHL